MPTYYSNTALPTTLSGSISSGATTVTVGATTGFPSSYPYTLALDFAAGTEELVSVSAAAGLNLTVSRGFSGTSAQSHSLGAVVRHVYHAGDATDFRTHEAATASVHGVTGALVGATQTQTLANKTLTAPAITNPAISAGGSLAGTFTGAPAFSGGPLFSRTAATDVALRASVTGDVDSRLTAQADGRLAWGPGAGATDTVLYRGGAAILTSEGTYRSLRASVTNDAFQTRITGDTNSRLNINADGSMAWGPGSAIQDTNLYRSGPDLLRTDDSLTVGGDLSVSGIGAVLFARKTAATTRTNTTTRTDDPHLTVELAVTATYELSGYLVVQSSGLNGDIALAPTTPAGVAGWWGTYAPATNVTAEPALLRPLANLITDARTYGVGYSAANGGMALFGLIRTTGTGGTFAINWAQNVADAAGTVLQADSFICLRRVA